MNYSDTERLKSVLEHLGYLPAPSEKTADFVLLNTCSVRQKAENRVDGRIKKISKMRHERPDLLIGVTGCMVRKSSTKNSTKRDKLINNKPVDIAFRIEDLAQLGDLLNEVCPDAGFPSLDEGELENYFHIAPKRESKAQVWVPIQTGCDKFCTYCIVPFARGREKSRPMEEILKECETAVENGAVEITLIGQTVDSYGLSVKDKLTQNFDANIPNVVFNQKIFEGENVMASAPTIATANKKDAPMAALPFITLLKKINALKSKGLRRLRYTSPHPQDFSEELIILHKELETLQPWIHLPVQSGNNKVLQDMRRTYTREHYLYLIDLIRKHLPDCAISTDIIVGFPNETEEEFMDSYNMMKDVEFDMAFMSPYSPRKGTHSQKHMKDNVAPKEKSRRFHMLNDLLTKNSRKKHEAFVGKTVEVLVEKCKKNKGDNGQRCSGRTPHYKEVHFDSGRDLVGQLVKVEITRAQDFFLEGRLA